MQETGIATARYVDHVGLTVPDMDASLRFFTDVMGARLLWRVGPFHETPTGMKINSVEIATLRFGPNLNLELLAYDSDRQRREMPSNIDLGVGHIAIFVDDLSAAASKLEQSGAKLFPGPLEGAGEAKKGERIRYLQTPWGAFMEILTRPAHMPYEEKTENRLFASEEIWTGGLPTAHFVDHYGLVVPDLEQAISFFTRALGAQHLWTVGPFPKTPTGVPIDAVRLAMLRLGPNLNVELQEIEAAAQNRTIPSNTDWGAAHMAFFVDDIRAAAQSLERHEAELQEGPLNTQGEPKRGEQIHYFKTPWGALFELVSRPSHLPYEEQTSDRLFSTEAPWPTLGDTRINVR